MNKKNPKVDGILQQEKKWREEFEALRTIALDSELAEELKWYQACYTLQGKNVVLIHGFKEFCALMFFKGALLNDPKRILVTPRQHESARQIRFTNVREIVKMEPVVKAYRSTKLEKLSMKPLTEFIGCPRTPARPNPQS